MTDRAPIALVDELRELDEPDREAVLATCSAKELAALRWCWPEFWARPDDRDPGAIIGKGQLPPSGPWTWWANIGGRGAGKTEACARWVSSEALRLGAGAVFHLVGQSVEDARSTMIEGPSGLLQASPPWAAVRWIPSVAGGVVLWKNGARARVFGADKARKARGPECNRMWIDDPAAFGPNGKEVLNQLLFGFRRRAPDGSEPRGVISSTPIDSELLSWIMSGSTAGMQQRRMVYSFSETDDNRSNLSEDFFGNILSEFAGTEREQQERFGKYQVGQARVFKGIDFNEKPCRVHALPERFLAMAVWIDPAVSTSARSCEVGICVAGLTNDGHVWIVEDLSAQLDSNTWPEVAMAAAERWKIRTGDMRFGVETNRGGDSPAALLRSAEKLMRLRAGNPAVSIYQIKEVFARKAKGQRATPLPRLYAAGQVHHLAGMLEMERQLRELEDHVRIPLDRADACVYAVLDLAGVLENVAGYSVGGSAQEPGAFGPAAQGAIAVGPTVQPTPSMPFTFGGGGDWR